MSTPINPARSRFLMRTAATLGVGVLAGLATLSLGLGPLSGAGAVVTAGSAHHLTTAAKPAGSFTFALIPSSAAVATCLPAAGGSVTIVPNAVNDVMHVSVHGMPPNRVLALFVIQKPTKPFGLAWYQSDLKVGANGTGSVTVQGVFSDETFSVSLGGTAKFAPTHQFHLGLWFDDPGVPFRNGCEPGATKPIVTPFDGDQGAGIQALNTAEFKVNGPLFNVKG